jgi:hypothetical protein
MSYNGKGNWLQNAYFFEGVKQKSFDKCNGSFLFYFSPTIKRTFIQRILNHKGHPDQSKTWHMHINPVCLYNSNATSTHSPLIGFAIDSYPIYGVYGYSSANSSSSPVKRMQSSYQLRNITQRTTYANGAASPTPGPTVNASYPIGSYLEDYQYVAGSGDLDQYNGRWCVTPQ